MSFCNLHNLCLRTFQVGTAFIEICTTTEPWVFSSSSSPISPFSPNLLLLAWPCDVSTPLHSTSCLLCQWQENWQLRPMLKTEWFRQGSKSVRPVAVPSCTSFPIFSSPQCRLFCLALPPFSLWTWRFSKMSNWMLLFRGRLLLRVSGLPRRIFRLHRANRAFFSKSSPPSTFLVRLQVL